MEPEPTILIVDEIGMLRDLQVAILRDVGRVCTATDGAEGLAAARRERPDLMVVDLVMPGWDGEAVCRSIKSDPALRRTRVLMLLPTGRAEDRARAVRAGADEVLHKPIERLAYLGTVRRLLASPTRGAPRICVDGTVRIAGGGEVAFGRLRNLSRGGLYVEADRDYPPDTEVQVEFPLPETPHRLSTSARVVWRRCAPVRGGGMGLRFLGLDATNARRVDEYVYERAPRAAGPAG